MPTGYFSKKNRIDAAVDKATGTKKKKTTKKKATAKKKKAAAPKYRLDPKTKRYVMVK